jgi:homeobox protein cut-like
MLYMMSTMEIEKHSASLGAVAMAGGAGSGSSYGSGQQLGGDDWQQEGFHHAR